MKLVEFVRIMLRYYPKPSECLHSPFHPRYREGRTSVIESGHTVLIGWNDRSLGFIEQISIARQDYGGGIICVLVEKNSEDIERKFLSQTTKRDMKGTRVIFRTGEPQSLACLKLVGIATARSVVLMSSGDDPRVADANTLRILIALRVAGLQPDSYIVAEGTREMNILTFFSCCKSVSPNV